MSCCDVLRYALLVSLIGGACPPPAGAEEVPLATYYASPRGEYDELRTYDNALLALLGGQVGINTGGGTIRAPLDVHGEAAAYAVGVVGSGGGGPLPPAWWIGAFGGDNFSIEGWDTIRGNYMPGTTELGGISHPSVTVMHAGGNVGVGNFSLPLPAKSPINRLDIRGAAVVGAALAGQEIAPGNGLLVQGAAGISLDPGEQAQNTLDVGGKAVIGSGYVASASPPANSVLVEGNAGVGVAPGIALANRMEVGGAAVIGPAVAGTLDLSTVQAPWSEASLGLQREARTTKAVKAPADGYPKAWMGSGGLGGNWAFGIIANDGTAGAITPGTTAELQVCAGDCAGLGGPAPVNVFTASSDGFIHLTGSSGGVDTLSLDTNAKLAEIRPGASLIIPGGAGNNRVLASETADGKAVWRAPTTPGLQGNAGTTPPTPTATRPVAVLALGGAFIPCNPPNTMVTLFEADNGIFMGCVGTAP